MKRFFTGRSSPTFLLGLLLTLPPAAMPAADDDIDKGRYLVTIAGCNDCHTDGWAATNGRVSEDDWLTGSAIGWRGPWGTTYASNLRLLVSGMPEDAWTLMLKTRTDRPPMPWMNVNKLSDDDARAIYRYIKFLGARGEPMPTSLDAQAEPSTPYFRMEPVFPGPSAAPVSADR